MFGLGLNYENWGGRRYCSTLCVYGAVNWKEASVERGGETKKRRFVSWPVLEGQVHQFVGFVM